MALDIEGEGGREGGEGEFLKMRTKAKGGRGGGGFLPSRTFAKKIFFY